MREHLLGYLLGALDTPEADILENQLVRDHRLQEDLELLRTGLEPLDADREPIEPPPGLAARTCRFVNECADVFSITPAPTAADTASGRSRWRLSDFAVAASVLIGVGLLFLPALSNSKSNAQIIACQKNLSNLGVALTNYSQRHEDYFPQIPLKGKLAAAGAYAPQLLDAGYLDDRRSIVCPASPLAVEQHFVPPTEKEVLAAEGNRLAELRRTMGGSYGYNLGYVANGVYHPTRNRHREQYVVMADAPSKDLKNFSSANHGGCGQNVLLEDGHIKFLTTCHMADDRDEIFCNDKGIIAPGTHADDAVIGHSAEPSEFWPASLDQ